LISGAAANWSCYREACLQESRIIESQDLLVFRNVEELVIRVQCHRGDIGLRASKQEPRGGSGCRDYDYTLGLICRQIAPERLSNRVTQDR